MTRAKVIRVAEINVLAPQRQLGLIACFLMEMTVVNAVHHLILAPHELNHVTRHQFKRHTWNYIDHGTITRNSV
jgi:hypothetical protein